MEKLKPAKLLSRLLKPEAALKAARELGGAKALESLLAHSGYAQKPQGLAARFSVELTRSLPLWTDPATVRSFGSSFTGGEVMASARKEAGALLPPDVQPEKQAASQVVLDQREILSLWPWISGQGPARLARAHLVTKDQELALASLRGMGRFARRFPPLLGLGWAKEKWLATRAVNWLLAYRFLGDLSMLDAKVIGSTILHLQVIGMVLAERLVSCEEKPQPDQVPVAGALLFLGKALAFLPEAPEWLELGRQSLGHALKAWSQERDAKGASLAALSASCEMAGLALWLSQKNGLEVPGLAAGLRDLAAMCRALAPPWGDGSCWGDSQQNRIWNLEGRAEDPFTGAANLAAMLLKEPGLRAGRVLDERLFWLFGPKTYENLRQLVGGSPPGARSLPGAEAAAICAPSQGRRVGLVLSLSSALGETEELDASALALTLSLDGQAVLQRPGFAAGGPLAGYLASRSAHNTVVVDQAEPGAGEVFLESLKFGPGHGFISASYNGYSGLTDPVTLRRRVFLDIGSGIVTLVDQIQAHGEHFFQMMFHLPPGASVFEPEPGELFLQGSFGRVLLQPAPQASLELATGRTDHPAGWRAVNPGRIEPCTTIVISATTVGSVSLTNIFHFRGD